MQCWELNAIFHVKYDQRMVKWDICFLWSGLHTSSSLLTKRLCWSVVCGILQRDPLDMQEFFPLLLSSQSSTLPTLAAGLSNPSPKPREPAELHLSSPSCSVAWTFSQGLTLFVSHLLAFLFHIIQLVCLSQAGDKSSPCSSLWARSRKPIGIQANKDKLIQNKIPRKDVCWLWLWIVTSN